MLKLSTYPNPVLSQIMIKVSPDIIGSNYTIYNHIGQEVMKGKLNSEITTIDWSYLLSGMYFIYIGENKAQTLKAIKL